MYTLHLEHLQSGQWPINIVVRDPSKGFVADSLYIVEVHYIDLQSKQAIGKDV